MISKKECEAELVEIVNKVYRAEYVSIDPTTNSAIVILPSRTKICVRYEHKPVMVSCWIFGYQWQKFTTTVSLLSITLSLLLIFLLPNREVALLSGTLFGIIFLQTLQHAKATAFALTEIENYFARISPMS